MDVSRYANRRGALLSVPDAFRICQSRVQLEAFYSWCEWTDERDEAAQEQAKNEAKG